MKKKEFMAGTVLLAASSALCLRLMKKVIVTTNYLQLIITEVMQA